VFYHGFIRVNRSCLAALAALLAGALACGAMAGELPADVRIDAFVRPSGDRLELLIRVPLAAMTAVEFPARGPGYLDLARADDALRDAAKLVADAITVYQNDAPLPAPQVLRARVSLASDRSFATYAQARQHLDEARLPDASELYWNQQLLDVLLVYPIGSDRSQFAIRPRLDRFGINVSTAINFLPPGGAIRVFEYQGDPGLVRLDPSGRQAALWFVMSGLWNMLAGADHLLFLLCLVIPFRRLRPLAVLAAAFTVGHSISLLASGFDFMPDGLWFPPLIETLIAVTIVYMALANIVHAAQRLDAGRELARRWMLAFGLGIVHGFGFSFALKELLQFAGDHPIAARLGFSVGIAIGEIAALLVFMPALALLFKFAVPQRLGIIIVSALAAHTAWPWLLDRWSALAKFPYPRLDAAFLASAMRGLMAMLIVAGGVWLVKRLVDGWMQAEKTPDPEPAAPNASAQNLL
jgi:HupE/UreJ protein